MMPIRLFALGISSLILAAAAGRTAGAQQADLVLQNGKIVTVDDDRPEAEALAVKGDRILAVGSETEMKAFIGDDTLVIDLDGRLAIPGFIEGHGHFMSLGRSKMIFDLRGARRWSDIVSMVAAEAEKAQPGEWILGQGWHQSKWDRPPNPNVESYPTHAEISRLTPDNPVLLTHASGHMSFANARAMELAGLTRQSQDPDGGEILRDSAGNPTGVLRETAQDPILRAQSQAERSRSDRQREADALRAVELATAECLSKGVTSFQDAGSSFAAVDRFKRLADEGKLRVRLWIMLRAPNRRLRKRLEEYRMVGYANNTLTVRAIKRIADGALGSHGAWLLEPYADLPQSSGLRIASAELLTETAVLASKHDFQLCVHAIGDRANREVLDVFQTVFRTYPNAVNRRWRIEHAQHLHPADIPRFAELGVIASMQGVHCTSDGPFVIERLGPQRARTGAYVWRSLLEAGALVTNGTDVPVEDIDPIASFYASVARRLNDGTAFFPEQCMTRSEALRSYTLSAAYAAFEEDQKGSLAPGKLADVVVLSKDILTVPVDEIPTARVEMTFVGGKLVFNRK